MQLSFIKKAASIILLIIFFEQCQVLKWPAAKVISLALPAAEVNHKKDNLPNANLDFTIRSTEGKSIHAESFRKKVIFLNIWATWCAPCLAELPSIDRLYKEVKDNNIEFILISDETPMTIQRFASRKKYEVPFYTIDSTSKLPDMYHTINIPTTFIISKQGKIISKSVGAEKWDEQEFVDYINNLAE